MKQKTILLVGGGTGGHLIPVFEIYRKIKEESEARLVVVGSGSAIEKIFFGSNKNYYVIKTGKINRSLTPKNITEFFKVLCALFQTLWLFLTIKPNIVFSKGGYVSFPVIFWARLFNTPYMIHESDIEMGLGNKYAAKKAKKIFVGFPEKYYKNYKNTEYSGQIIKIEDNEKTNPEMFGFQNKRPTILITGGSQGSLNINKNMIKIVPKLLESYNIIHQTGANDFKWVCDFRKQLKENLAENYYVIDFLHSNGTNLMPFAINLADVVIARAGANTIAELALRKKAMVLIPYKYAAGDHQAKNAQYMAENESAFVLNDDELAPSNLLTGVDFALKNEKKLSNNAYNLFPKDGLTTVTREILNNIKEVK